MGAGKSSSRELESWHSRTPGTGPWRSGMTPQEVGLGSAGPGPRQGFRSKGWWHQRRQAGCNSPQPAAPPPWLKRSARWPFHRPRGTGAGQVGLGGRGRRCRSRQDSRERVPSSAGTANGWGFPDNGPFQRVAGPSSDSLRIRFTERHQSLRTPIIGTRRGCRVGLIQRFLAPNGPAAFSNQFQVPLKEWLFT